MNKSIFRTVLNLVRAFPGVIAAILLIGISQTFVGMYALTYFQRLIDGLPAARQFSDLAAPLAIYIILTVLNHLLIYLEGIPSSVLEQGVLQWVKLRALEKLERIDFQAYQDLGTGNLIQTVENGSRATQSILTGFYLNLARAILPQLVISLAFIHQYDSTLSLVILAGYGLLYVVAFYTMRYLRGQMETLLANQEDFSKFSVRAFMELVVFRVNGRFKAEFERLRGISDEIVRARAKIYLAQELFYTGFGLFIFIVEAIVIVQQIGKILVGASTVGTLVALLSFIHIVFYPITMFSSAWVYYRLDSVTFNRFMEFFALPEDPGLAAGQPPRIGPGQIEFKSVSFDYQEQEILRDFSLVIPGGRVLALVGSSGGGKSTLVRLLLQLLKPKQGQVCIDGQDLRDAFLPDYYAHIAYIPQDPPVFDGTLLENLTIGRQVSPERVAETLRQVRLEDLPARLPQGLHTRVGERGAKLSGGERQRLAFGRVLLQDPRIVILDEPTSALDSLTEDFITQNLIPFFKGKTVILVAHRLQTVRNADEIIVLEHGRIVQRGVFHDLARSEGPFKELWQKQGGDSAPAVVS